ncbi:MAG TPA: AmmeMemoRadiSam system protein A [Candidatus Kryptonia bacterium]
MLHDDSGHMGLSSGLSAEAKVELLKIARRGLEAVVKREKLKLDTPVLPELQRESGAFVTLREKGELRGCIGYIEPRLPMYKAVAETASKAATSDPRFEPVTEPELEKIDLEVSILSALNKVTNVEEIVVGRHGLVIERGYYRGLLLPQVAGENNWDRNEFLRYTCFKAGLDDDSWRDPDTKIYSFTAEVFGESEFGRISEENIAERA